ncbi:MAG: Post-segregation antitoxin CcdA [Pseudomonadota bacterium]|jgi:post-segregation antitoxin (ccd killing protein)
MDGHIPMMIDLPADLVAAATRAGLDIAGLTEAALRRALHQRILPPPEPAEDWARRNRDAIDSYEAHLVAQGGPFGTEYRTF